MFYFDKKGTRKNRNQMKKIIQLYTISLLVISLSCKTIHNKLENEKFDYFVRKSINFDFRNLNKFNNKWREINNDTVIYTQYFKGAVCDIPDSELMKINIKKDTLYFNYGLKNVSSDCERKIGVSGIVVDFVLNKKKHPKYKEIKFNYIKR